MKTITAKRIFEDNYQKTVSLPTWYRIQNVIRHSGLNIDTETLKSVGSFYRYRRCFAKRLTLEQILLGYLEAKNKFKNQSAKGKDIYEELERETKAHSTTIIRWFKNTTTGGFNQKYNYKDNDLITVYFSAFLYTSRQR